MHGGEELAHLKGGREWVWHIYSTQSRDIDNTRT